jgi:hypothetical protein
VSQEPRAVVREDMVARVKRFASLRAAQRSLSRATRPVEPSELDRSFADIRSRLTELSSALAGEDLPLLEGEIRKREALADIDARLGDLARELRGTISTISIAQLRATLPALCERHRDEVEALADLCLVDDPQHGVEWGLVDYLVTLLASEAVDDFRRVRMDPTEVTARVREACAVAASEAGEESARLAAEFDSARSDLVRGAAISAVISCMRSVKEKGAEQLLVPDVLRSVVAYNIAVWNRIEELQETDRVLADAEQSGIRAAEDDALAAREADDFAAPSAPPSAEPTLLDDAPLAGPTATTSGADDPRSAVARALRARIFGEGPIQGAAGEIARSPEVRSLPVFVEAAFRSSGDAIAEAVCAAISVGLLLYRVHDSTELLHELGVDPALLRETWQPEADAGLQEAIQRCLSDNAYTEARQLAEVRTKFLLRPLEGGATGWSLERDLPDAGARDAEALARVRARAQASMAEGRRAAGGKPTGRKAAAAKQKQSPTRTWIKAAMVFLAFAAAITFHVMSSSTSNVDVMSRAELAVMSPHLESGYRNGFGLGPLFIGTVGRSWDGVPQANRVPEAEALGEFLQGKGISEVMLFDSKRRLQMHYKRGVLKFPR